MIFLALLLTPPLEMPTGLAKQQSDRTRAAYTVCLKDHAGKIPEGKPDQVQSWARVAWSANLLGCRDQRMSAVAASLYERSLGEFRLTAVQLRNHVEGEFSQYESDLFDAWVKQRNTNAPNQ